MNETNQKFLVDDEGEITLHFHVEGGDEAGLQVKASHPDWKPGNIVTVSQEMMYEILGGMMEYTTTGKPPRIGSEKPRTTGVPTGFILPK